LAGETTALFLALLIGISLGALGSGGSIVTLPILVYVAGVAPKSAIGMSMAIVGGTSCLGCYFHWRRGNFCARTAVVFGATGILGAYIGSTATHLVSSPVLMLLFSLLMLVVGVRMIAVRAPIAPDCECQLNRCIPAGFVVGLVTGFLGIGGGFLIVPALVWFAGLDVRRAIGTSLAIIAVNSASGLAGQLRYARWDWSLTGEILLCSLVGMGFGIVIATRCAERSLRRAFAVAVIGVGTAIAWQVLSHFSRSI
jgi:uncharacterized membrane protein YfcA